MSVKRLGPVVEMLKMVEFPPRKTGPGISHQLSGACASGHDRYGPGLQPEINDCRRADYALDVTIQAQILELMNRLQKDKGCR